MVRNFDFKKLIAHMLERQKDLRLGEVQEIINEVFEDVKTERQVLQNVNNVVYQANSDQFYLY